MSNTNRQPKGSMFIGPKGRRELIVLNPPHPCEDLSYGATRRHRALTAYIRSWRAGRSVGAA